jgi:Tol biopolymer transport system component
MKISLIQFGLCELLLTAMVSTAGPVQLITARDPSVPLPAGGNGDSAAPVLSADGRFVLFTSAANDLVPGGNSRPVLNVYLRDRASNTTALVSVSLSGADGGNGNSMGGMVSSHGRFVVFQSDASDLVPNDTNILTDIFVRDIALGTITLVSIATNGGAADGPSTDPVMTPDGRYVAFVSKASNLAAGDTNQIPDIFVRDLADGSTSLITVGATGGPARAVAYQEAPVLTPDGRYVAFFSSATGLAGGVPANTRGEIYVRDRSEATTTWASVGAAPLVLTILGLNSAASYHPRLSEDGRYVAFKAGPTNGAGGVLVLQYDRISSATVIISTNSLPAIAGSEDPYGPEMTPDGQSIAYVQREGTNGWLGYSSVHVWSSGTGDLLASDPGTGGVITSSSRMPALSSDARRVIFLSNAGDFVTNGVSAGFHIYSHDLELMANELIDVDTNGGGSVDEELTSFAVSADGAAIAFDGPDGCLVDRDSNRVQDVFVRDAGRCHTEPGG